MFRIPNDKTKYTAQWKYVEVATFSKSKNKVFRLQVDKKPVIVHVKDLPQYVKKYGEDGFYTSVWQYNSADPTTSTGLSSLYFDLDSKDDDELAYKEATILLDYLTQFIPRSGIHVYFTGLKGFHLECEALCLGISASTDLHETFRYIANSIKDKLDLKTLDFSVYDARRMWRYPNTKHQKSGLYKVEILDDSMSLDEIKDYAKSPQQLNDVEQTFDYKACRWYREFTYEIEAQSARASLSFEEMIERFNKGGSSQVKVDQMGSKDFDPKMLFDSCHAIGDLWDKAEKTGHLEHEERLFLLSILSYTPDALEYLYSILRNCKDFNEEISKIHIEDWIRRREAGIGGRPYSCATANAKGIGCGDCNLERRKKWENIGGVLIQTEEEASPSPIRYGYSRKQN